METIVGVSEVSFSVIIPHYNIPDLLARCVDSIPQRDDIQVIVVDDHSPDGGNYPQMIQSLRKNNVEFVYAPRHGGAGYARNLGLERALGKWLIFADADDFFSEEAWDVFDALYVTQWHLFRLFNEDRNAFDRCFTVALDNNVPCLRTIAYLCWYSHGIKAKMRVLAHSLRLYLT